MIEIIRLVTYFMMLNPSVNKVHKEHKVSWYGKRFQGKKTANGDTYDINKLTCATTWDKENKRLGYSFGSKLKVTNIENGKSVIVEVNDTGGFKKYGRKLDLSKAAFYKIANLDKGVIKVNIIDITETVIN